MEIKWSGSSCKDNVFWENVEFLWGHRILVVRVQIPENELLKFLPVLDENSLPDSQNLDVCVWVCMFKKKSKKKKQSRATDAWQRDCLIILLQCEWQPATPANSICHSSCLRWRRRSHSIKYGRWKKKVKKIPSPGRSTQVWKRLIVWHFSLCVWSLWCSQPLVVNHKDLLACRDQRRNNIYASHSHPNLQRNGCLSPCLS